MSDKKFQPEEKTVQLSVRFFESQAEWLRETFDSYSEFMRWYLDQWKEYREWKKRKEKK